MTTEKIHSKCDFIHGPKLDGVTEPITFSIAVETLHGFKIFRELQTIISRKN